MSEVNVKEVIRRRKEGETWKVLNAAFPGAYSAYWSAVGKDKRAETPAAIAARKAWKTRRGPDAKREAKRAADRAYQAKRRAARKSA